MSDHDHTLASGKSAQEKRTIGELVAGVSESFSTLVRDEIKLAQTQLTEKVTGLGKGAGFLAVAGVLIALYAVPVLLLAAIYGLGKALPLWLSALIIGLILVLIAVVLALLGLKMLKKSKNMPPPNPKAGMQKSVAAVKKGLSDEQ